ncbi:alpha/beta hydrolase [candidate division WOR-3 bacterium]|nr:alpha/beta hydrolase [candidate division WOR-3 bacterium]
MIFYINEELYSRVQKEDINRIKYFLKNHTLEKITIKDKEWDIIDTGTGKETILIFSGGLRKSYLSSFSYIDVLKKDYRIIAPSYPKLNKIKNILNGIEEIIKNKKINRLYVMGHSFGGIVAQCYADLYPRRVKKLILINTLSGTTKFITDFFKLNCKVFSLFKPETALNLYKKQLISLLAVPESNKEFWKAFLNDTFFNCYTYDDYLSLQNNQWDYMKNYSSLPDPYKGKVLIVNSKDDKSTIKVLKNKLYERYPNARVYNFETGGHIPSWSKPDEFEKIIKEFLK